MVLLGVAVAVVAVLALREPDGHDHSGTPVAVASGTLTPTATASGSTSRAHGGHGAGRSSATGSPGRHPSSSSASPSTSPKDVPLVVLNNTTITGLAQQAAQRFEDGGWTVTRYGNYQNDILSTCAYYDPAVAGARAAAEALQRQFPSIKRVKQKFPELPDGPIVVVLTPDYATG